MNILLVTSGRAGVPMEVMGLMLGEFVDDYTVRVIDVFAMPQSGTVSHNVGLYECYLGLSICLEIFADVIIDNYWVYSL